MGEKFLTNFADGAVMIPMGIGIALLLVLLRQRRAALAWTVAVGGVWALILVLKLIGYSLAAALPPSPFSAIHLVTPSGHVASAAVVYGGLAGLLFRGPGTVLGRSMLAALAVAVTIGVTRVALGDHSVAEVVVGAVAGVAGAVALARIARAPIDRRAPVTAAIALILLEFYGMHLSWEHAIHRSALQTISDWRSGA